MAFNLNKNDGTNPAGDSSNKSKFDLSKSSAETVAPVEVGGKTNNSKWVLIALILLVVGVGGWYFLTQKQPNTNAEETVAVPETASQASTSAEPDVVQTEPPVAQESNGAAAVKIETASDGYTNSSSSSTLPSENKSTSANSVSGAQTDKNKNNSSNPIQSDVSVNTKNESTESTKKITAALNKAALEEIQAIDTKPNHY
jgi:hypothetical protein